MDLLCFVIIIIIFTLVAFLEVDCDFSNILKFNSVQVDSEKKGNTLYMHQYPYILLVALFSPLMWKLKKSLHYYLLRRMVSKWPYIYTSSCIHPCVARWDTCTMLKWMNYYYMKTNKQKDCFWGNINPVWAASTTYGFMFSIL